MGAESFATFGPGPDVERAFRACVDQARHEYGSNGYSGSIGSKGGYVVLARNPLTIDAAHALADKLMEAEDQRIYDKHGPAGAVPVWSFTREVQVTDLSASAQTPEAVLEAATAKLREQRGLRKGERVLRAELVSYQTEATSWRGGVRRVGGFHHGTATVTIRKADAPVDRVQQVKVSFDHEPTQAELDAAVTAAVKAKLKDREHVVRWVLHRPEGGMAELTRKTRAVSRATSGKAVTRYVVNGENTRSSWERGHASQADARAAAVKAAESAPTWFGMAEATYSVEGVTRREDGSPLVVVERKVVKAEGLVDVTVRYTPADATRTVDGWLFFGYAPS